MFDIKRFGAYLSGQRKQKDMTQSELADRVNVTRQAVSKWETGESFPDISLLAALAEALGITLEKLVNSGQPTCVEAKIMRGAAQGEVPQALLDKNTVGDIVNLAPLLKPSLLDNMADSLARQGIDISSVVALAEYMNSGSVAKLLESANSDTVDERLLERLMPFLDETSKGNIFDKILDGRLDIRLIRVMLPYMDDYFRSQVEAAVVEGVLEQKALEYLRLEA